ncbi:MAG: choice-of-anchor B domain-containing protein [Polaribacter sp.]|jgi:choice-of-anchor B domain-containing protein
MLSTICVQAQVSMNMDSLFNWQDPSLVPSSAHFNTYNEIWGYADGENEYAIIGTTAGTHIFDVTNPSTSEEVVFIDAALTGPQVIHRDYHDYEGYLYIVCDEGASTLQIVDLSMLPDTAELVYDSNALFPRSHNIFIDTSSARMYVCGGTVQFAVYSLADPELPTLLVNCPADVPFWSSIGYVHDVFVRGDTAYLNAGDNGLFIVDFSNLADIRMLGSLDVYTQSGYNHSGWLMDNEPYYALADETHGMDVKIIDVSDMSDLDVTDTIGSDVNPVSIPHNLIYKDEFLYVSYYFDGLYMFDCTNPANPSLAGFYDTSTEPHVDGWYRGCWGVYPFLPSGNILVSDMQSGLWVLSSPLVSGIGENQVKSEQITVYPNPATDILYLPQSVKSSVFQIIDMQGKIVFSGKTMNSIEISGLSSGLYTILVQSDEAEYHSRFVKQ